MLLEAVDPVAARLRYWSKLGSERLEHLASLVEAKREGRLAANSQSGAGSFAASGRSGAPACPSITPDNGSAAAKGPSSPTVNFKKTRCWATRTLEYQPPRCNPRRASVNPNSFRSTEV